MKADNSRWEQCLEEYKYLLLNLSNFVSDRNSTDDVHPKKHSPRCSLAVFGVIGSPWMVDDTTAKHVDEAFYEKLFKDSEEGDMLDCTQAASALNHATHSAERKVPPEQRFSLFILVCNSCRNIALCTERSHRSTPGLVEFPTRVDFYSMGEEGHRIFRQIAANPTSSR
jgi:hypothetical protein